MPGSATLLRRGEPQGQIRCLNRQYYRGCQPTVYRALLPRRLGLEHLVGRQHGPARS